LGWSLPSLAPVEYRSHEETSLRAYAALFDTIKIAESFDSSMRLKDVMIIQRSSDELIDYEATNAWGKSTFNKPTLLKLNGSQSNSLPSHLMIDQRSTTVLEWDKIKLEIKSFLSKTAPLD
jgi:hypothetical protein